MHLERGVDAPARRADLGLGGRRRLRLERLELGDALGVGRLAREKLSLLEGADVAEDDGILCLGRARAARRGAVGLLAVVAVAGAARIVGRVPRARVAPPVGPRGPVSRHRVAFADVVQARLLSQSCALHMPTHMAHASTRAARTHSKNARRSRAPSRIPTHWCAHPRSRCAAHAARPTAGDCSAGRGRVGSSRLYRATAPTHVRFTSLSASKSELRPTVLASCSNVFFSLEPAK